jgi:hypothetical protein
MKPIRTPHTTAVFKLPGGTEENDMPVEQGTDGGDEDVPVLRSTWALTDEERRWIADGGMVELVIFGTGHPPVAMHAVDKSWNVLCTSGEVEPPEQTPDYRALLARAAHIAEHLFAMIDRQAWRDTGGDDGQGHYEGEYRAAKIEEEIRSWKEVVKCPECQDRGEVPVTPGQPGDGSH